MTTYYVSATGNDANNGTTTGTPWATLNNLVPGSGYSFSPGDEILLKRDDTFRITTTAIDATANAANCLMTWSGTAANPIVLGSYGTGAKPILDGGIDLWTDDGWVETSPGSHLWRHACAKDIGNLIFDSEASVGAKIDPAGTPDAVGEFRTIWSGSTSTHVELYSESDPHDAYTAIVGAQLKRGIYFAGGPVSNVLVTDLVFQYQGWHAITMGSSGLASNITIENSDFRWLGGCSLSGAWERNGSGIEPFNSNSDITIRYNTFDNIWENGIGVQSTAEGAAMSRIYIHHNRFSNFAKGIEVWTATAGNTLDECVVAHNVFYHAGSEFDWANRAQADYVSFVIWSAGTHTNCVYKNNVSMDPRSQHIYLSNGGLTQFAGWDVDYNCYHDAGNDLWKIGTTGYDTLADWQTACSQDAHSITGDPLFVSDGSDYHLTDGSPCADAGVAVTNVTHPLVGAAPDIGIYELPLQGHHKLCPFRKA